MNHPIERLQPKLSQHGIEGLIDTIDGSNHRLLTRLILAADKRFVGLAQFARDWVNIEKQLDSRSVPEMAREYSDYLALELQINQVPAQFSLPGRPAILLGLNHEAYIEPVVLVSLLHRNDMRILGMKIFQYLGPRIAEYILPVLPKKVAVDYHGNKKPTLFNLLEPIYRLYLLENRTVAEIGHLNQLSIQHAADHLSAGGVLITFPGGGQHLHRPWYRGTGEILSLLPPEVLSSTPIYPISTTGLSKKLFLQKARQAAFVKQRPASVQINVYDPIYIPTEIVDYSPEQLVDYLKAKSMARLMPAKDGQVPVTTGGDLQPTDKGEVIPFPQNPTL